MIDLMSNEFLASTQPWASHANTALKTLSWQSVPNNVPHLTLCPTHPLVRVKVQSLMHAGP